VSRNEKLSWILLKGSPKEIGQTYGATFKEVFIAEAEALNESLKVYDPHSVEEARLRLLETLQKHFPYLVEEMNSIAEATDLEPEIIQLIHFKPTFGRIVKELKVLRTESIDSQNKDCSNIAFKESDRGPLLGKTLDGSSTSGPNRLMAKVFPEDGHGMLLMMYLGTLNVETGINDKGFAVGNSSIHFHSTNPGGISRNLMVRLLLQECANTEEGIEFLKKYSTVNRGYNFMLLDKDGNAANVERSPTDYCVRRPENGVVFCVNHCMCENMIRDERLATGKERYLNSRARWTNLQRIASKENFKMTLGMMKNILRNHAEPGGICQHGSAGMYTNTSFVHIPLEGRMLFTVGNPCRNEFQVISFN